MSSWWNAICTCYSLQLILTVPGLAVCAGFTMRLEPHDVLLLTVLQGAARHRWSSLQGTDAVALLDEAALYSVNHTLGECQSCHVSRQACMLAWQIIRFDCWLMDLIYLLRSMWRFPAQMVLSRRHCLQRFMATLNLLFLLAVSWRHCVTTVQGQSSNQRVFLVSFLLLFVVFLRRQRGRLLATMGGSHR